MKKILSFFGRSKSDAASLSDSDIPSGFDSDGFADAYPPNGEDFEDIFPELDSVASGTDKVPLPKSSSRSRRRTKNAAVSVPGAHVVISVRTRDMVSFFVRLYNADNPGKRITASSLMDKAAIRQMKRLSPEVFSRVEELVKKL